MMPRMTRQFYIPAGSVKIADKQSSAVAYLYEDARGRPCVVAFRGRAQKPALHVRYPDAAARARRVSEWLNGVRKTEAYKAEQRKDAAASAARGNSTVQVGHIFRCSWGYEQTNIDYYEVTRLIGKTMVELRKVAAADVSNGNEPWATGKSVPSAGDYIGEPFRRRVTNLGRSGPVVRISDGRGHAFLWNGRPDSWTAYH